MQNQKTIFHILEGQQILIGRFLLIGTYCLYLILAIRSRAGWIRFYVLVSQRQSKLKLIFFQQVLLNTLKVYTLPTRRPHAVIWVKNVR